MAFQFRNRPYVTEGGVDPQSVVNFLKDTVEKIFHGPDQPRSVIQNKLGSILFLYRG